ncbi:MAG: YceI family protein [Bacteroidia bacterium]|nr:YceI family protein [Bacteroidia bacterium]
MKHVFAILFLLSLSIPVLGQERLRTAEGMISFDASSPLEDIVAKNDKVNGILDAQTGEIAVVLLIKDFQFRKKLMQEHFNENYMESERYPKAIFSGTISGWSLDNLDNEGKDFRLSGELTMHGVSQPLEETIQLKRNGRDILCTMAFIVRTEDHKIKVPRVLFKKVAKEVNVRVELELSPE